VTLSVHNLNGNRIAEHDGSGAVLREYLWLDGRPLAVVEGGKTYWLHWDHILRPVLATDATGAVVWAARYLPFGGIDQVSVDTGALTQTLRFPGQWFQAETGLHQNGMRDYDPTTGRYLQADPLGLVDGPSVYGYARQSPVRYIDPRGTDIAISMSADAALGFGHVGMNVNNQSTVGLRPVNPTDPTILTSTVPGEVSPDTGITEIITILTTLTQDRGVASCIERGKNQITTYNLWTNQCTTFVRQCLAAAGIETPDTIRPKEFFDRLKRRLNAGGGSLSSVGGR
jgi:RHS repeat-associated protein